MYMDEGHHFGLEWELTGLFLKGSLEDYAPILSNFTHTVLNLFEVQNPRVKQHHPGHPLACTTFNFGPSTYIFPHKDLKNLSWGFCLITSLGMYDPAKGGHLVLWDLKLVVEFPPYSTILIPSAILLHSNTAIGLGETRYTFTQYSSAGLFARSVYGNSPKGGSKDLPESWWRILKHMFSKLQDLITRK